MSKTYTRTVETLFSLDEIKRLFKEAHEYCKREVKPTFHRIGKRGRPVIMRPKDLYQKCIREYIQKKVEERVKAKIPSG